MRKIFAGSGDNLLVNARGKLFINCATISPQVHVEIEELAEKAGAQSLEACMASSITQAREGQALSDVRRKRRRVPQRRTDFERAWLKFAYIGKAGEAAKVKALVNMVMNINTAGLAEGLGLGAALGLDLTMLREVFSQTGADSRVLANRRRRHAEPRAQLLFLRRARRQRQRDRARTRARISGSICRSRARPRNNTTA